MRIVLCVVFWLELGLGRGCEENALLVAVVNDYKGRVQSLVKKDDEEEQNIMALLRELRQSKHEVAWLGSEKKLLQQTTEGNLGSAVW